MNLQSEQAKIMAVLAWPADVPLTPFDVRLIGAKDESDYCWACSLGKCGQGPFVNTCSCCRSNHTK